jgi:hypothetical protein
MMPILVAIMAIAFPMSAFMPNKLYAALRFSDAGKAGRCRRG